MITRIEYQHNCSKACHSLARKKNQQNLSTSVFISVTVTSNQFKSLQLFPSISLTKNHLTFSESLTR
ncbi:hypothetical protein QN277_001695 [Acacia crassicarpa]|uniref:Uncharacterized protein n=1 Tax=Acacia crassicarpa TaxID=499986 RepID=A0AAE1TIL9_9FABA|nr:hypothetical protein QN277_001695 [Acacia crassicarpa]